MPTVVKKGWMIKQGAVVKNWKHRWFVLDSNDELLYYVDEHSRTPKGTIDMSTVTSVVARELCVCEWDPLLVPQYCFGIVTPRRVFHMACENARDMADWMAGFKRAARLTMPIPVGASTLAPAPDLRPRLTPPAAGSLSVPVICRSNSDPGNPPKGRGRTPPPRPSRPPAVPREHSQ